jgi:putative hydrolase of the HAD superfamily
MTSDTNQVCLVFDLDDTLYPEASYARSGLRAAGEWAERELGLAELGPALVALFDGGRRGDLFDAGLAALGRSADKATVERLVEVYRTHAPELAPYEDAIWALVHYGAHVPLGLITDGYAHVQQSKVAALGIARRFRHIVYTDALGGRDFWKPSPAGFAAIERAVPEASAFIYVGDNASKDFVAPNARGWRTIRIVRPTGEYRTSQAPAGGEPHDTIPSLMRLPELLGL